MLGYSKQAYYQRIKYQQQEALDRSLVISLVQEARVCWKKGSGRNLYCYLREDFRKHRLKIGRDKFFDILRENGLQIHRRRHRVKTTDSNHPYYKYPNLIKELIPLKANEIWVSDITYVWIKEQNSYGYLSLVTDLYSHRIMGYHLHNSLKAEGPLKALEMAVKTAGKANVRGCIHHSDRGIQYCCHAYVAKIKGLGIMPSMTEQGDPKENAVAERVNGIIKNEFTTDVEMCFATFEESTKQLKLFIDFYNNKRPHGSIDRLTPLKAYSMEGELKRTWKNYSLLKWLRKKSEVGDLGRNPDSEVIMGAEKRTRPAKDPVQ